MIVFVFIGLYVMPLLGFLFVIGLVRTIRKVVKDRPYQGEMIWTAVLFAVLSWTLAVVSIME